MIAQRVDAGVELTDALVRGGAKKTVAATTAAPAPGSEAFWKATQGKNAWSRVLVVSGLENTTKKPYSPL